MQKIAGKAESSAREWLKRDVTFTALAAWKRAYDFQGTLSDLVNQESPSPNAFSTSEEFRHAYWKVETWSKFPFETGIDRDGEALKSFALFEEQCRQSNSKLYDIWSKPIPEGYRAILRRAQFLLADLLRGFSLDEVIDCCGWSTGATTSLKRSISTPQNKWVEATHITRRALPYFYAFSEYTGWVFNRPTEVIGNVVQVVPKNAKTGRTIAIEPDWNMFFQLGVGGAIRRRLQTKGLLRNCAKEVNMALARKGSVSGDLCTIDLKGASDTISLAIVEALFPEAFVRHLENLRSPKGHLPGGGIVTYEKISSMGNGFTFELETALFWAICKAASGHAITFGDDIIVRSESYELVTGLLEFCGFSVNMKKSHYDSPFRESCGGHYFNGMDVTPPYFRKKLQGAARLTAANRLVELVGVKPSCELVELEDLHRCLARGVPRFLWGPYGQDGTLWVDRPAACLSVTQRSLDLQCLEGTRLVEKNVAMEAPVIGAYMQSLYGSPGFSQWQRAPGNPVVHYTRYWLSLIHI